MAVTRNVAIVVCAVSLAAAACSSRAELGELFGDGSGSGSPDSSGAGDGGVTTGATSSQTTGLGSGSGIKYDVGDGTGGGACDPDADDCACSAVDILFVVDNSLSMGTHQSALASAFPGFVDAMFSSLEAGTSLHVGVTTTEFLYQSAGGNSMSSGGTCTLEPQTGSLEDVYVTAAQQDLGKGGTQGKLRVIDGRPFYEIATDAGAADRQAFTDWFGEAVVAGENGSNIEMSSGAAGWVGDPDNAATNAGFVRDAGAVYVIVFIQDEFDQTPADGQDILDMVSSQKTACGGLDCVVGGGWFNATCNTVNGYANLHKVVEGFADSFVRSLGFGGGGIDPADLSDVLADIITQKCDEIPPEG